jgi:hypothetical protein
MQTTHFAHILFSFVVHSDIDSFSLIWWSVVAAGCLSIKRSTLGDGEQAGLVPANATFLFCILSAEVVRR